MNAHDVRVAVDQRVVLAVAKAPQQSEHDDREHGANDVSKQRHVGDLT
jgi:hypothetical protein